MGVGYFVILRIWLFGRKSRSAETILENGQIMDCGVKNTIHVRAWIIESALEGSHELKLHVMLNGLVHNVGSCLSFSFKLNS